MRPLADCISRLRAVQDSADAVHESVTANRLPSDGVVTYHEGFIPTDEADEILAELLVGLDWRAESARFFGRTVALPRLTAWYGPAAYSYSGVVHAPAPLPPILDRLAAACAALAPGLDCVLANRYRSGADSVGFHADDEPLWGEHPTIASLSFGVTRRFVLKHRQTGQRLEIPLAHGSLLVMTGTTQEYWLHAVPRSAQPLGERVNLTFRRLAASGAP